MGDASTQTNPSWLLRLFQSEYFDIWFAITYLFKYPDPGVQHYLCEQLSREPSQKLQNYLPQLWCAR